MTWLWLLWLGVALVLVLVELLVVDLFFLMIAGGALGAALAAGLGAPLWVQLLVLAVASVALLVLLRPWALRLLRRSTQNTPMNADGLVGRSAVVLAATSAEGGRVKLAGEVWSARFDGAGELAEGTEVEVERIDGAVAVVAFPEDLHHDELNQDPAQH